MSATAAPARPATFPQGSRTALECCESGAILYLFGGALAWLVIGSLLELIDSLKLHLPSFLAGDPLLTYGRVEAASDNALLYGFGVPVALGVGLWLLCRLGRTRLAGPGVVLLGAIFWNLAVLAGMWAILRGGGTGYEAFAMPPTVAPILFFSYLLIGICGLVTFHAREAGPLYPSQWFVLGAMFWFAWIFSTAALLLLVWPVRGVLQASVNWWYAHNLSTIFFGFAGLAWIFYIIPKGIGRPLSSRPLAALAFWMLAVFGSWGGIPEGAPLPGWMVSLAMAGTVLTLIPLLAVAANLYLTARDSLAAVDADASLRFAGVGLIFWLVAGAQQWVGALPGVGNLTDFTWFTTAQHDLFRYGFFAMTMFGAIYYIVPRLAGVASGAPGALWKEKLTGLHFWLMLAGVLISYIALGTAGVWQGVAFNEPGNTFVEVMRSTLPAIRMSTLGYLLVVMGTIVFLLNFALLMVHCCARCCRQRKGTA